MQPKLNVAYCCRDITGTGDLSIGSRGPSDGMKPRRCILSAPAVGIAGKQSKAKQSDDEAEAC